MNLLNLASHLLADETIVGVTDGGVFWAAILTQVDRRAW
jgi:hypothetical protein